MKGRLDKDRIRKACLMFGGVAVKCDLNNAEFVTALKISLDTTLEMATEELVKQEKDKKEKG